MNRPTHGGNIYEAALRLKLPERKIIDMSASINPLGVSKKVRAEIRKYIKYLPNYPDPNCTRLKWQLSKELGQPGENIVCGNGSTEMIYLITKAFSPRRALIPAPTFSEYERAVRLYSPEADSVKYLPLKEENGFKIDVEEFCEAMTGCDMAFICNPNNPTASLLSREEILHISLDAAKKGCLLVVDEAFIDFVPQHSITSEAGKNPFLVSLRSLTKYYALSGLRIGYGVFHEAAKDRVNQFKEPWTVNTLAQRAAVASLRDWVYRKNTSDLLEAEKEFFEGRLREWGVMYYPSEVNFYLLRLETSKTLLQSLMNRGILIRDCRDFKGLDQRFVRVAIKSHADNMRFLKVLKRHVEGIH